MPVDIELNVLMSPDAAELVRGRLNGQFELYGAPGSGSFTLRHPMPQAACMTVDQVVQTYIHSIEPFAHLFAQARGVLRIATYSDQDGREALSVILGNATVADLARFQFAIDMTCHRA